MYLLMQKWTNFFGCDQIYELQPENSLEYF